MVEERSGWRRDPLGFTVEKPDLCHAFILDFFTQEPVQNYAPIRRRSLDDRLSEGSRTPGPPAVPGDVTA